MEVSVPGIVYLSTIPTFMRVNKVREIFSEFGEVNRIFLAPNPNVKKGFKEVSYPFQRVFIFEVSSSSSQL